VDAVLAETGRQSRRQRQLPARVVVYYVMALSLYAQASYGEVLRCLLEGVRWLRLGGIDLAVATKSAITRARIRLGAAPLRALFERLARPVAAPRAPGIAATGWLAWTAPPSTCRIRPNSRPATAGPAPRAGPAASRSCACSAWPNAARTRSSRRRSTATT
jgi:hypothetical protein